MELKMKTHLLVLATALFIPGAALACSPAPSCWMKEGPSYLRSVCQNYKGETVAQIAAVVDEPEKVPAFIQACKRIKVR
jgi:hypothetical protein